MATTAIEMSTVHALIALQVRLIGALRSAHPAARDLHFLLDFPTRGEVAIDGETWRFDRHGAGVAFTSSSGVVVDVHRGVEQPEVIDAWRLIRYLETGGAMAPDQLHETAVDAELRTLAQRGKLTIVDSAGGYRP